MWWGHHIVGLGWGGWLVGALLMLLFWGGLITMVILLIRAFSGSKSSSMSAGETAVDILKKRYARGEISKEEYDSIRHDLES